VVSLYKPEAAFYLAFIALNLHQDKNESGRVLSVINMLEDDEAEKSPMLIFAKASILMKTGKNNEAIQVLHGRHLLAKSYPFYYLDYLEGVARLNNLDFSATTNFEAFVNSFKGRNYLMAARQRMSWIAFLKGDSAQYRKWVNDVRQNEAFQVDEDKQVLREISESEFPNYHLLRARLLFDGGYYSRALAEMLDNPVNVIVKSKKDFIEYLYRLGRIYHQSGNTALALGYYEKTIINGISHPYYFAVAAAWQMGIIYENQMEWEKAEASYKRCLSMDTPEYKTSLRQKAKAGLERVRWKLKPDPERGLN
jgi:tetratricopeptide (TPR) repeat protein